jgi:hypothetical protein
MPLTASRNTPYKDGALLPFPVAAGAKIFGGALAVLNAAGFAAPGSAAVGLTYLGRSEEFVDNTGGADGAKTVLVHRRDIFKWLNSGADPVAQADVGKIVYILDDQTVAKTNGAGARSAAGKLLGVDADGVWVE